MGTAVAYLGMYLLSIVVAQLVALQLGDHFRAGEELALVLMLLPVAAAVTIAVLASVSASARRTATLNVAALLLAAAALAPAAMPEMIRRVAMAASLPYQVTLQDIAVIAELVVPVLAMIMVQWGLLRRRRLRLRGEEELSLWPWFATGIVGLAVLNPLGLEVLHQAVAYRPDDWLRDLHRSIALSGAGAAALFAFAEYRIRRRMLRRRLGGGPEPLPQFGAVR